MSTDIPLGPMSEAQAAFPEVHIEHRSYEDAGANTATHAAGA
jgi:hypothetical protein